MSVTVAIYGRSKSKQKRLLFAAYCVSKVFPGVKDDQMPKERIFDRAARFGRQLENCPDVFYNVEALKTYIRNKWPTIRLMLAKEHGFLPVYVNGQSFGGGGGYRKGDRKHAQKQVERDAKIADGVVSAANDYAEATVAIFPQVTAERRHLVARQIGR
jgi:hypothetical protein